MSRNFLKGNLTHSLVLKQENANFEMIHTDYEVRCELGLVAKFYK